MYRHMEEQAAEVAGESAAAGIEEERLLAGGNEDFPDTITASIDKLHGANIVAVACWPGRRQVLTGSGILFFFFLTFKSSFLMENWDC